MFGRRLPSEPAPPQAANRILQDRIGTFGNGTKKKAGAFATAGWKNAENLQQLKKNKKKDGV